VDLDPLAIELAKLALWIETMDASLPFGFLDHKLKAGNGLVGCWFDRFRDYPSLAFERDGGDKGQTWVSTGDPEPWTRALKRHRNDVLKPALGEWLRGARGLQGDFMAPGDPAPEAVHAAAAAALAELHSLPVHDAEARAALWRERLAGNAALGRLREAFDTWCALWFWPVDALDLAPLPAELARPSAEARAIVRALRERWRFFHWELEFADVFTGPGAGFAAVLGNPPWEIAKPNSKEFFSNRDPLYRAYGKQEALREQRGHFAADAAYERAWYDYAAGFRAWSNFSGNAGAPFGDPDEGESFPLGKGGKAMHAEWRRDRTRRRGYADPRAPVPAPGLRGPQHVQTVSRAGARTPGAGGTARANRAERALHGQGTGALRTLFLERASGAGCSASRTAKASSTSTAASSSAPSSCGREGRRRRCARLLCAGT
jgi:hypothetical protein